MNFLNLPFLNETSFHYVKYTPQDTGTVFRSDLLQCTIVLWSKKKARISCQGKQKAIMIDSEKQLREIFMNPENFLKDTRESSALF